MTAAARLLCEIWNGSAERDPASVADLRRQIAALDAEWERLQWSDAYGTAALMGKVADERSRLSYQLHVTTGARTS